MNSYVIKLFLENGELFTTSYVRAENILDEKIDNLINLGFKWWQTKFDRADVYLQHTTKIKAKTVLYKDWLKNNK